MQKYQPHPWTLCFQAGTRTSSDYQFPPGHRPTLWWDPGPLSDTSKCKPEVDSWPNRESFLWGWTTVQHVSIWCHLIPTFPNRVMSLSYQTGTQPVVGTEHIQESCQRPNLTNKLQKICKTKWLQIRRLNWIVSFYINPDSKCRTTGSNKPSFNLPLPIPMHIKQAVPATEVITFKQNPSLHTAGKDELALNRSFICLKCSLQIFFRSGKITCSGGCCFTLL